MRMGEDQVDNHNLPVVLLCGGKGRRLRPKTKKTPKPLLRISQKPIVRHIMENFVEHGFKNFVLCLGYKSEAFIEYFGNQEPEGMENDRGNCSMVYEFTDVGYRDTDITLVDTGVESSISDRLRLVREYIDSDRFFMTYGDVLANVDIQQLLERHSEEDTIATVTGVQARSPFGILQIEGNTVKRIEEKPLTPRWINSGFFVYETSVFDYFTDEKHFIQILNDLGEDDELSIYCHEGFFKGIDTHKDLTQIREITTETEERPWIHGTR
jgi:glucose-1-phosphate cytidylyltransferase